MAAWVAPMHAATHTYICNGSHVYMKRPMHIFAAVYAYRRKAMLKNRHRRQPCEVGLTAVYLSESADGNQMPSF